jgi:phi13 family phage major tail protein
MANKVKFGLSNVHIAPITSVSDAGVYTYGTIFEVPGAVNLTLDASGDTTDFFADNIKYYTTSANQGYTGSLEMALLNEDFRTKILNEVKDSNGVLVEDADYDTIGFALGFQIEGDTAGRRYWYYNVKATRPNEEASTIETTKEPQTETFDITASPRIGDHRVKVMIEKTDTNTTTYNGFFSTVYESSVSA